MNKRNFILSWKVLFIIFGWLYLQTNAYALPFGVYDSRTMAMGGVGVATGARYASFNNPALLTTADEIHEWFLLLPTTGEQLDDSDDLKDNLADFKRAAIILDGVNNLTNRNAVQASLNAMDGSQYRETNNLAVMLAIPSRILSGAVFLNSYEISNALPLIGGDNLTIPTYTSTFAHRGVRIVENGVSAAKILESRSQWLNNLSIGFNVKFLLIETYAYSESIRSADVKIETSQGNNSAQFAIDAGAFKEFGVWKVGMVAKNLLPGSYNYGVTGEKLKIEPQLRAGFAYQSRFTTLEFNIDLTKNDPVGFDTASQVAAVGWEWFPWQNLTLRAGYNKNLIEPDTGSSTTGSVSAGIGLLYSGFHFDVAGYTGGEGDGISAQLGLQF